MIGPKAAVAAIKHIAENASAEPHYTAVGEGVDWSGFSTSSDPTHSQQAAVITNLLDVTVADGLSVIAKKEGLDITPKRLDLFFDLDWHAQQSNSELYANTGFYVPPWMLCELWVCQMASTAFGDAQHQSIPTSSQFSTAMWLDRSWAARKLRPEFFNPELAGHKPERRRWRVLYHKVFKFVPQHRTLPVPTGTKTAVIASGIPTGLIDAASGYQPFNHIVDTDEDLKVSTTYVYKSIPLYKATKLKYFNTTGTTDTQVAGRLFMATRWWHPCGFDYSRALEIPPGLQQHDYFKTVSCGLNHRVIYMP